MSETQNCGWFRAMRSSEPLELIKANPDAFIVAYMIAFRGRYHAGFNSMQLGLGEALLGDYANYGMTKRRYRTAKKNLAAWGFATFKTTPKGTIARLTDTRLFAIFRLEGDTQNGNQGTHEGHTRDTRATPNKIYKKEKNDQERGKEAAPELSAAERVSKEAALERVEKRLEQIRQEAGEDPFGRSLYNEVQLSQRKELKAAKEKLKQDLGFPC
jgi:hypothetical protein